MGAAPGIVTRFDPDLQARLNTQVLYWGSEECVVVAKVAVDALRTVGNWRRGHSAVEVILPPGTPLASFLDRQGRPHPVYDGGEGLGIAGNQTTHAGVLAGYLTDPYGGILGIKIYEVYPGSRGVRRRIYPLDDGRFGTGNARNYHAILDRDLTPLGGAANPYMAVWRRLTDGRPGPLPASFEPRPALPPLRGEGPA